ncbi:MAG: FGGY family carbohydrate kinase [Eubacteriales bacterium]|nr:FGGY family carbohydrate kinase [Eubacteriales bacterium]
MEYILTADIGTTALKATVYGVDGKLAASCTREYLFETPAPGQEEMAAEVYTETFAAAVREVTAGAGISAEKIGVIGFSTQGETMLLLDEEGRPLRRAILWCDSRATAEAGEIVRHFGAARIRARTGQVGEDAIWPGAKLLWVKKHEPGTFEKIRKIVQLEGWFSLLLTGEAFGEDSILGSSIYYDIREREYWPEMLAYLGITEQQLPQIALPGEIVGRVTREAAARFGLAAGTPVSIGGIDLSCGGIGVGNIRPGSFSDVTGSSLCTMALTEEMILDPRGQMPCYCSAVPGLYMIHAYASGGIGLRWFRDVFFGETFAGIPWNNPFTEKNSVSPDAGAAGKIPSRNTCQNSPETGAEAEPGMPSGFNAFDYMDELAADCPPGAEGLIALPHFIGSGPPDLCPEMNATLVGLSTAHGQKHIVRAIMEGVAMNLCRILEATEALGLAADRIVCLGGGAKSPVWCQIKADASGKPVITTDGYENAGCMGAAMLAGTAAGLFPSLEDAAARFVHEDREYLPDQKNAAVYETLLGRYRALMQALMPIMR